MNRAFNAGVIVGITIYESGDVIVKRSKPWAREVANPGKKRPLYYLSSKARTRMLFVLKNTDIVFRSMYCLSYGLNYPQSGREVKSNLNTWLTWFRRTVPLCPYFWFLEFQARSAPHVHIYMAERKENLPHSQMAAYWSNLLEPLDFDEWQKVRSVHAHTRQLQNFRSRDGYIRYAAKYALKNKQKNVPNGFSDVGRFWGCSREVTNRIHKGVYVEMTERAIAEHLYKTGHRCARWDVIPKIIFDCFT